MTLAERLERKYGYIPRNPDLVDGRAAFVDAINEAIDRCAEVAESGGVNVADPETAARIRALKVSR